MLCYPSDRPGSKVFLEGFVVMDSVSRRLSLPKNWPQSVKTAVVHVINGRQTLLVRTPCDKAKSSTVGSLA